MVVILSTSVCYTRYIHCPVFISLKSNDRSASISLQPLVFVQTFGMEVNSYLLEKVTDQQYFFSALFGMGFTIITMPLPAYFSKYLLIFQKRRLEKV